MGNVTSSLVRVTVGQTGGGTGEGGEEEHQMHTAKKERLIPKMGHLSGGTLVLTTSHSIELQLLCTQKFQ